jgi:hypothetical protein
MRVGVVTLRRDAEPHQAKSLIPSCLEKSSSELTQALTKFWSAGVTLVGGNSFLVSSAGLNEVTWAAEVSGLVLFGSRAVESCSLLSHLTLNNQLRTAAFKPVGRAVRTR